MARIDSPQVTVKKLGAWIKTALLHVPDSDTPSKLCRLTVRQVVKGNKSAEEVLSMDVPKKAGDDWAVATANELWTQVNAEAAVLGGVQKYFVYSYYSDDPESHASRFAMSVQTTDEEDEGYTSEGTDKHGQISQLQRHIEVVMRVNSGQTMTVVSSQNALISKLTGMLEKQLEARMETIEMVEELARHKHEQELAQIREVTRAESLKAVAKRVSDMLIPAIANKLTGGAVYPIEGNPLLLMTKAIVTNMASNEDRMKKLMAILSPEEQIAFMNLYEELIKGDKDKKEDAPTGNGALTVVKQ